MSKALIEKAFEKWQKEKNFNERLAYETLLKPAFIAGYKSGATWQREQLDKYKAKDLLDEIHTNYMRYHADNYDTKDFVINLAGGSVVVMDKQGYQELKKEREQLEAEKNKLIKDIEICRKATNGTDDYSVGMRNGMEVILCTLEKREPRMDNCLPRTNNLSEREQLEAEIEKLKNINKVMNDQLMKNSVADLTGVVKDIKTQDPREQLIKELREWIESNKELRGYTGIPDDTLNIILAKLDLLEGEK